MQSSGGSIREVWYRVDIVLLYGRWSWVASMTNICPSLWPSGIGAHLWRNRLWVRSLAVSEINHISCSSVTSAARRYDWQWSEVASSHQPCYTNLLLPSASTASRPALSHDRHGSLPRPSSCAQPTRLLQWGPRRYVSVPDRSASIRSPRRSSPCPWSTQVGQRFGRHARQTTLAPLPRKGRVQTL